MISAATELVAHALCVFRSMRTWRRPSGVVKSGLVWSGTDGSCLATPSTDVGVSEV